MRLFYLRTHYRKPVEFSEESLADAKASLDRIWAFRRRVPGPVEDPPLESAVEAFRAAMDSDLDNAGALAVLFNLIREGNRRLDAREDVGPWVAAYDEITGVLGLDEQFVAHSADAVLVFSDEKIAQMIDARAEARANRDWSLADKYRDELAANGIILEDTADGVRWHRG